MKRTTWLALILMVTLGFVVAGMAQQRTDEKVVCPVSGETMLKSEAKASYTCPMHPEVQSDKPGKCPKCGMNLEKKPAAVEAQGGMGMGMAMKEGQGCPMMGMMTMEGTMVVSEDLKDGIAVRITSQDPETVKKLQEMGAKIKAMHEHKHEHQ